MTVCIVRADQTAADSSLPSDDVDVDDDVCLMTLDRRRTEDEVRSRADWRTWAATGGE